MAATVTPPPTPVPAQDPEVTVWVGATRVAKAKGVTYESRLSETGSWSFSLAATDPQISLLAFDTVVCLKEFGAVAEWGIVDEITQTTVAAGEEAEQRATFSGRTVIGELDDALVYGSTAIVPWGGDGLDGLRLAETPYTETRFYNWASPDRDRSGWTSAVELFDLIQNPAQSRPSGFDGRPAVWPDPSCKWIASRSISGGAHPPGVWYATAAISTVGIPAFSYDFFAACGPQDTCEVWINGVLVCEITDTDATKAKTFNVELSNDPAHRCVVRVTHAGAGASGEITGFALEAFRHYDDGGGLLLSPVAKTSSAWTCLDYPAATPSWYVDEIIADLIGEAQTRGGLTGWTVDINTATHKDSNGQNLPLVEEFVWRAGDGLHGALRSLAEQYIEFRSDRTATNGRKLTVTGIKGDPVPGGGTYTGIGAASGHSFTPGQNGLTELTHHGTAPAANVVLTRWAGGFFELPDVAGRRKEAFLSIADVRSGMQTFWHTADTLEALQVAEESVDSFQHRMKSSTQYAPGDTVTLPNRAGVATLWRCQSRAVTTDSDGNGFVTATFGAPRDDETARIDRWQRRSFYGTLDGRSESATPGSQWVKHQAILTPVELHFSGAGGVVIVGDRGTPFRGSETLLLIRAELEADVAGASGATTARVEVNGASIGTVTAAVSTKRGTALLTRTLIDVFDVTNMEITAAGGHSGVTVTVYAMAATWA